MPHEDDKRRTLLTYATPQTQAALVERGLCQKAFAKEVAAGGGRGSNPEGEGSDDEPRPSGNDGSALGHFYRAS